MKGVNTMELFWILLLIPILLAFINPVSAVFGLGLWLYQFNFTGAVIALCVAHFWAVGIYHNYSKSYDNPPAYATILLAGSTITMLIIGIVSKVS